MIGRRDVDAGTGYGRPRPTSFRELTDVGPGTPMGELLRRYWHPIGLAGDAGATPIAVRVLGEDLVLFRDGAGRRRGNPTSNPHPFLSRPKPWRQERWHPTRLL